MSLEYEIVPYDKIKDIKITLADISCRPYHEHKDYEVLAVLRGRAKIRVSTSEFYVSKDSIAVFNSRQPHKIDAEGGQVTALTIQFSPFLCREYYPHARRLIFSNENVSSAIDKKLNGELMDHICRTAMNYFRDDRLFELKCLRDIMHLLVLFAENLPCKYISPEQYHRRVSKEARINAITSYLDTKYQHSIRLGDVAKLVEMTPAYLSHFFSKNIGISFQEYLNNLRFEHALRQIDRKLPLRDIAEGSGFSDPKYMTKMFVKKTGMTPSEYRNRFKKIKKRQRQKAEKKPNGYSYSEEESLKLIQEYLMSDEQLEKATTAIL